MDRKNYIAILVVILIIAIIAVLEFSKPKISYDNDGATKNVGGSSYQQAPEIRNIDGWINSDPLTIASLSGKVVLIDFWTYSCINCIRTFPYLNEWHEKYSDDGLVIIGVHTPEFEFEKDYDNVLMATQKYGIKFAVALDNGYGTWRAYQNNYWPRKYLIDKDGYIRYDHIGEGSYDETEEMIQLLLAETGKSVNESLSDIEEQTPNTINTRELYLGYSNALPRGQNIGNDGGLIPEISNDYKIDGELKDSIIYLEGKWRSDSEAITTAGNNASLHLNFIAKKAHVVLDGPIGTTLQVTINGLPVNTSDVTSGNLIIDGPRLYTVYSGEYGRNSLKIYSSTADVNINSFTFG